MARPKELRSVTQGSPHLPPVTSATCPSAREHIVQLFDAPRSLADAVSRFLIEGHALGNQLLVIARPSNLLLIEEYLERRGLPINDQPERITMIDASSVRRQISRRGILDFARVHEALERMVAPLAAQPGGLRIYGEVVDLLAEEGNFTDAAALEDAWNVLQEKCAFTLFCGYSAAHFADPDTTEHLHGILKRHTSVRSQSADSLGSWLTTR